ncbi:MAG: hypothetical protein HOO06_07240 [Bdellovibrionaceae bacterium]|nr:hypothetical protein [Pseudobdellovibrionaceae bacterium]
MRSILFGFVLLTSTLTLANTFSEGEFKLTSWQCSSGSPDTVYLPKNEQFMVQSESGLQMEARFYLDIFSANCADIRELTEKHSQSGRVDFILMGTYRVCYDEDGSISGKSDYTPGNDTVLLSFITVNKPNENTVEMVRPAKKKYCNGDSEKLTFTKKSK